MDVIYVGQSIDLNWSIRRNASEVLEDFSRADLKVFLTGNDFDGNYDGKYYFANHIDEQGRVVLDIDPGSLTPGTYCIEGIWIKNSHELLNSGWTRSISRARKDRIFKVSDVESECTDYNEEAGHVVAESHEINIATGTTSYGYDGMSAYETAIFNGSTAKTEKEWIDTYEKAEDRVNYEMDESHDGSVPGEPQSWANAELKRKQAEGQLGSSDPYYSTSREKKEADRQTAESNRASAETSRGTAETQRQKNEGQLGDTDPDYATSRIKKENDRQTAESGRASAESGRVSAENTRVQNEGSGGPSSAGYSTSRIKKELDRQSAESSRATAETSRQEYEGQGDYSDTTEYPNTRRAKEAARQTAETARATAETARQKAEGQLGDTDPDYATSRIKQEIDRQAAEAARELAETARENAKISSTTIEYAVGDSGTTPPSSGWQSTVPSYTTGDFLWGRTTITFGDGTSKVLYAIGSVPDVAVSQNASTGKTTITVGSDSYDVATEPVSVSQNTNTKGQQLYIGGTKTGNIDDFFNVNSYYNKADAYADGPTARSVVSSDLRALGMTITYFLAEGWITEQFIGTSISDWGDITKWKTISKVGTGISDNEIFNSIIKELYFNIPQNEIAYFDIDNTNDRYILYLLNSEHTTLLSLVLSDGLAISTLPYIPTKLFIAVVDANNIKTVQETPINLYHANNLNFAPAIANYLYIGNDNAITTVTLTEKGTGYVNENGTITAHANSRYSTAIPVKKGDIVKVYASETNGAYVISYCNSDATQFEPVVPYSGIDNDTYLWIANKEGYICISWHNAFLHYTTKLSSKIYEKLVCAGESAYDIAVDNGFEGTEQEWLASLKGERGEAGTDGARGPQGLQGNSGYSGAAGELEIVNNLTDGGATAALSAEQGKKIGNFIDINNIPLVPKKVNPINLATLNPEVSNWHNLDADGSVSQSKVDVYDEVYEVTRPCIELVSTNSGRFAGNLSSSVNLNTSVLRVSVCLQKDMDVSKFNGLTCLLYSNGQTDAAHRAFFLEQYGNPSEGGGIYNQQYVRGGWYHFCVCPKDMLQGVGNSFDITNVTAIGFHCSYQGTIKIYVNEISVVNQMLQPGIINIVDNFDVNVPDMADYATSKGVKLNLSIIPNWIGTAQSASLEEINRCKRDGHFIFNHTFNHITDTTNYTEKQIVQEITKANSWMLKNGFARGSKCISNPSAMFPFAKYKAYMESPAEIIYHHWTTMPSTGKLVYYPFYPMSRLLTISALDSNSTTPEEAQQTLARMKAAIDEAEALGGIAVIGSHGTFWTADDGVAWKELIDYIATKTNMANYGIDDILEGNYC